MYQYFCILENGQRHFLDSPQTLACNGCRIFHKKTLFTSIESEKPPAIRQCIGRQKNLMVTPSVGISFVDILQTKALRRLQVMPYIRTRPLDWSTLLKF